MNQCDRRRLLRTGGALLATTALAGCTSSSSSDTHAVGDTITADGLDVTLLDYAIDTSLTYVPAGESGGESTTVESEGDRKFVVLVFDLENTGDGPAGLPSTGNITIAEGNVFLRVSGNNRQALPVDADDPNGLDGRYQFDGDSIDRLAVTVGEHDFELASGESIAGWVPFSIPESSELETTEAVCENPNDTTGMYKWALSAD